MERPPLRFGRNEFAGALGDLGTDTPLIVLLVLVCKMNVGSVLILFGVCQIIAGLAYRLPIPVQPLKAVAAIALAENISGGVLAGGGLAVGLLMLALCLTGGLGLVERVIPKPVVRGLQFGLGIKLALLALGRYLPEQGPHGYVLGAVAFLVVILLRDNRSRPAAPFVLALGLLYLAVSGKLAGIPFQPDFGRLHPQTPSPGDILTGLVVLAIPQLPLSLGNAVLATKQTVGDLFPGREVSTQKLGLTYSLFNIVVPLFGGIPVCQGSGGVAGFYAFGARTGGSVIIYGSMWLLGGLFFSQGLFGLMAVFPKSILAVLLLVQAITLMQLSRDMAARSRDFFVVLVVGLLAVGLPHGFCIGMVVGAVLNAWLNWNEKKAEPAAASDEQSESNH